MSAKWEPPYAVEAIGYEKKEGETAVMRHFMFAEKLISHPPDIFTMWQMYLKGYHVGDINRPFLGTRRKENGVSKEYVWESHKEVKDHIENVGKGLIRLGLERQSAIGVYSVNRREWTITEIACYREAFILVALYDTLGEEAIKHVVNETDMQFIVTTSDKIENIIRLQPYLPTLKTLISMDNDVAPELIEKAKSHGLSIFTFKQVEELGSEVDEESDLPTSEDIATICYTSGTTGVPKGAVLTQANCVASTYGVSHTTEIGTLTSIDDNDIYISYLPMAHVFERVAQGFIIFKGCSIGYFSGDTAQLMGDIAELKPTIFVSVPRLFNRIYDKVLSGVNAKGGLASYLFYMAYNAKKTNLPYTVNHWVYDRFVFKPVRESLGGRVRFILSGSAPIASDVMEFLKICFSSNVHEGYGQTENYCGGCLTILGDNTTGVVGAPFPCSEVKLVDVPDMEYYSTDKPFPRGEICIRGSSIMKEYYKNPEKTAEAIDREGWLHTGDIGMFDEANRVVIIDRLKNIFKLSQGEYVAPEKIESVYQKQQLIAQAFVYGDSKQSQLVGVFVPDRDMLLHWASKQPAFAKMTMEELCLSPNVKQSILKELGSFGKENQLKGFEQVKAICLTTNEFTIENELLTPTFKLKRELVRKLYDNEITEMYNILTNGRSFN
ncbi:acetyl-CoA synthetase-like protein [Backusella circina FSU 941]|nr:acetyl-CoA synthetase-like protein [Backusella circina FSU 941]